MPALIKGLFMTGRGTDIFQECRLAPGAHRRARRRSAHRAPRGEEPDVRAMAKKLKFDEVTPGVVPHKAAILLGDLRAKKAVPRAGRRACIEGASGDEHRAALIALGYIATPAGGRRHPRHGEEPEGRPRRARLGGRCAVSVG